MRITSKQLQQIILQLNTLMGRPLKPYDEESHQANVGNFCTDEDDTGVALVEMRNPSGAVTCILPRATKRVLYYQIVAMVWALEESKKPEHDRGPKEQPVCPYCEGHDISATSCSVWDMDAQDWVITTVYDDYTCENCGSGMKSIDFEEIES